MNLRNRTDFVAMDETTKTVDDMDAPIVWMGYGIDAPEFNWNDYKDVDVKGKVLLMLVNQPPSNDPKFFAGGALTYYGRWTYKYEQAARMGAVGVHADPQDRDGQLRMERGAQLVVRRARLPARRPRSEVEGGLMDSA